MYKILVKILGKKFACKLGFHNWIVIKSIRLSNIIFLLKKHNKLLNKINYDLDYDYIVYDRKCKNCNKEDFNIDITKKIITEKIIKTLKTKL